MKKPTTQVYGTVTNLYLKGGWLNPRLVSALVDGRSVRVRVKTRAAHAPGQVLALKRVEDGIYDVVIPERGREL
jgi:hypothetical protein